MPKAAAEKAPSKSRRTPVAQKRRSTTTTKKPARKAPTQIVTPEPTISRDSVKIISALAVAVMVIVGTSVAIGMTDPGVISVTAKVNERAEEQKRSGDIAGSEATKAVAPAPRTQPGVPNGGLVGSGNRNTEQQAQAAPVVSSSTASSTASTTEETASSTEALVATTTEEGVPADQKTEESESEEEPEAPATEAVTDVESVE